MDITIRRANEKDYEIVAHIGRIAVEEAHGASCSAEAMKQYLDIHYNNDSIIEELNDPRNTYHIIYYKEEAAGFSKIVLNAPHPNILLEHSTKLDRIYLLKEFFNLKLGFELLHFNIELSKASGQSGMWLFTWTGNERAINFYKKCGFAIVGSHEFKVSETHYNPNHQMLLTY